MKKIKQIINAMISGVYPNKCISCGEIIGDDLQICNHCESSVERVDLNNVCMDCGLEKENCICKYNIYRFNSVISVFENTGLAQRIYYSYKFNKKQHYALFLAKEIVNAVNKCYNPNDIDLICFVPSFGFFGYDHCRYIAKMVSQMLKIPFADDLISCIKKTKKQHKSNIKERLVNVNGKYRVKYRIDRKRVLLIDDIKTTGATLDECSRVLLFAGAESVNCVTVLGATVIKK